jgi:hypothetical protein
MDVQTEVMRDPVPEIVVDLVSAFQDPKVLES